MTPIFFLFEQIGLDISKKTVHVSIRLLRNLGPHHLRQSSLSAYIHMSNTVLRSVMENQSFPAVLWEHKHKECKANNAVTNLT